MMIAEEAQIIQAVTCAPIASRQPGTGIALVPEAAGRYAG